MHQDYLANAILCLEELDEVFQTTVSITMLWQQWSREEIGPNNQQKELRWHQQLFSLVGMKSKTKHTKINFNLAKAISETLIPLPHAENSLEK